MESSQAQGQELSLFCHSYEGELITRFNVFPSRTYKLTHHLPDWPEDAASVKVHLRLSSCIAAPAAIISILFGHESSNKDAPMYNVFDVEVKVFRSKKTACEKLTKLLPICYGFHAPCRCVIIP